MSDEQDMAMAGDQPYESQVNAAFAEAWNSVFNPEDGETPPEDSVETAAGGDGEEGPAPAVEQPGEPAPRAAGDEPGAAPAAPAEVPVTGAVREGEGGSSTAAAAPAVSVRPGGGQGSGRTFAEAEPLLNNAAQAIHERTDEAFRNRALEELRGEIDKKFLDALEQHPRMLVGDTVPSIKDPNQTEVLRSSEDARDWQEALKSVITAQVNRRAQGYADEAKPLLSTVQNSVEMFRRNPDLIPGTKDFDPVLAGRVVALAKSYEHREDGKLFGYRVDIQPLIGNLRDQLTKERAATPAPAAPAAPTARQEQAANQARNQESGQFEAPQAGIPSRSGMSGTEEEDFNPFWDAVRSSGISF